MNFAEWLKKKMEEKEINGLELYRLSGVPDGTISRILSGVVTEPRKATKQKLIDALNNCPEKAEREAELVEPKEITDTSLDKLVPIIMRLSKEDLKKLAAVVNALADI